MPLAYTRLHVLAIGTRRGGAEFQSGGVTEWESDGMQKLNRR